MSSVSGLSLVHRQKAKSLAKKAAYLGLHHEPELHYTQGPERWEGIAHNLKAYRGQYPTHADCSAFVTWCLWNGLDHYGVRDTVNGQLWKAGYTGTMLDHGKEVTHQINWRTADAIIYGNPGSDGEHTALIVEPFRQVPLVISHGSEGGPFLLPWNYRTDVMCIRRYI